MYFNNYYEGTVQSSQIYASNSGWSYSVQAKILIGRPVFRGVLLCNKSCDNYYIRS